MKKNLLLFAVLANLCIAQSLMSMFRCCYNMNAVIAPTQSPRQLAREIRIEGLQQERLKIIIKLQAFPKGTSQERANTRSNPEYQELKAQLHSKKIELLRIQGRSGE